MPYCPACSAHVPEGATACPICGSPLVTTPSAADEPAAPTPELDPETLRADLAETLSPHYEILRSLGTGGMGAVFLAREPVLRRLVAIKVLAPWLAADPRARSRFEREARAAAALSHPNVVRVYAVGQTRTRYLPYIIMQYVDGPTLAQRMARHPRASERDARRIIGEVAAGLAAAHARDLVHRDVKPSNILIETESHRAFVMDFGVSAALSPVDQATKLTMTGAVVGTPPYMSPEQAAGDPITAKSDMYSLGLVAYELLTGQLPYTATTAMGWAAAHLRDPATPVGTRRPDLPPEIAQVVDRCLAKDAPARPDAQDVAAAMLPSLEHEVSWPPPGLASLHGRGRVLARLSLFTAIGGLLTVFGLAFTPRIVQVHPSWLERFASLAPTQAARLAAFRGDPAAVAQFIWQTALIIGLAAFATSLVALATVAIQATGFALAHRRRGWSWMTLIDVAVDPDGRSGLALAGAREFASMDDASRAALLAARRIETAAEIGAGPWVALIAALWTAGLAAGLLSREVAATLMNTALWLSAALPVLAGLVVSALARYRGRRLMAALVRRPRFQESDADIAAWYASAPAAARSPTPAASPPRRALVVGVQALASVVAAVALLALAAGATAALVAALATSRLGPAAFQLTDAIAAVDRVDPIGTARQLAAPLLPVPGQTTDSVTRFQLQRLVAAASDPSLPDYAPAPATLRDALRGPLPQELSAEPGPGDRSFRGRFRGGQIPAALLTSEAFRRAFAHRIPADTVRLLRQTGQHPRTALFRQLTHAEHWDLPDPRTPLNRLDEAALANLLGAIGDVAAGDVAAARRRLGENAAAGLVLLRVPTLGATALGDSILESLALVPLAELEQLAGNGQRAVELREGAQRVRLLDLLSPVNLGGLAADPAHLDPVIGYLRDRRLPAGWRATLMTDVIQGACTNPREVLLGASLTRRAAIRSAAAGMPDVPEAPQLAARVVDLWNGSSAGGFFSDRVVGLIRTAHTAPPPVGFVFRVAACLL
jgi:Protein kinase domain